MIRNFIVLALRNFRKEKTFTIINIFGLSIAAACFILSFYFIKSEFTYDSFHRNSDRIYQALLTVNRPGNLWGVSPFELAEAAKNEIASVESAVRYTRANEVTMRINGNLYEYDCSFADPGYFSFFDFPVLSGNAEAALEETNSLLISRRAADMYFSDGITEGAVISIKLGNRFTDFSVKGVFENVPDNSSMKFDYMLPFSASGLYYRTARPVKPWGSMYSVTFLMMKENADPAEFRADIAALAARNSVGERWNAEEAEHQIDVQKLTDIHFNSSIRNFRLEPYGNRVYSYILGGIALLVLLIACINSMNISIGLSSGRSREIGVRKVFGARRSEIIRQFWAESVVVCFLAMMTGLMLAELFLPVFNTLSGKNISLDYYTNPGTFLSFVSFTVITGILYGSYPALVLSRYQPAAMFRKSLLTGRPHSFTRTLTGIQFTISVFLIICAIIMAGQFDYISSRDLGFRPDRVIVLKAAHGIDEKTFGLFKENISGHHNILNVSGANGLLYGDENTGFTSYKKDGEQVFLPLIRIDPDFIETTGLELVQGRNFSYEIPTDSSNAVIVNEAYVKQFRLPEPIGAAAHLGGGDDPTIIGVVKDFHFESMRLEVKPMALFMNPRFSLREILVRIGPGDGREMLEFLEAEWNATVPDMAFSYNWMSEGIADQYSEENRWRTVIQYSSILAILISCLGVFGITSLSATRRIREMSIRKVLGASTARIVMYFNKELVLVALAANIPAWPAAYFVMDRWLGNFAYKSGIGIGAFVLTGVLTTVLAAVTISVLTIRTARTNPADTLRYE